MSCVIDIWTSIHDMRYSRRGYWGPQIASFVVLVVGLGIIILVPPKGPSVAKAITLSVLTAGCLGLALSCYRRADEVILQRHKTAWFWGSMAALCLIVPLITAVTWHLFDLSGLLPFSHATPEDYFTDGALSVMLLQALGFALYCIWCRFRSATS